MSPAKKPLDSTKLVLAALIAVGSLSCAVLVWSSSRTGTDHSRVPLSRSEYLKDVVEPVAMVAGMAFDDGGSHGLVFKDSRQVVRSVCLLANLQEEQNLSFGSIYSYSGEKVPIGGAEEKAFLGLLERWYRQDPDAKVWNDRMERNERSTWRHSLRRSDETKEELGKGIAVLLLRSLRKRN